MPQARGQWMPQATGQANAGIMNQNLLATRGEQSVYGRLDGVDQKTITNPIGATGIVSWNIFNGFRGVNGINQAAAQIHQSREILRNIELQVLQQSASVYMGLLADIAIYDANVEYIKFLEKQLEETKLRLEGGELSMTDVNQTQNYLFQGKARKVQAYIRLQASLAAYKQVIQSAPVKLEPAKPVDHLIPANLKDSIRYADSNNPAIIAARYNVEVNTFAVKIAEGALAPTVSAQTSIGQNWNYFGTTGQRLYQGSGSIQLNVPLYEGGVYYSQVRQAKEKLGEAELLYDQQVNATHQQVEASWAAYQNAQKFLEAAKKEVKYAQESLEGLREEVKYGTRSVWEVLNYQQRLVQARIEFISGQRDRVLSSYNMLAAIGGLSANMLDLDVPHYMATDHYDRVKNQFFGLEPWK
jgi:outer membrane protein